MEPVDITAGRLHLRAWTAGDEPVLVERGADPVVQRWTSLPDLYLRSHAEQWVQQAAPAGWASGRSLSWAVCDSTTAEVVGGVTLRKGCDDGVWADGVRADGVWAVASWCAAASRGQGVVPEVLGTVSRWAFAVLDARRLQWTAEVGDWASRRTAEKAGFRVEGVLRGGLVHRGEPRDCWIAGLLPGDPQTDTAALPAYPDRSDGVVLLRRWRSSDAPDVARACADEQTARWLPVPVPYTLQVAEAYVDGIVPTEWAAGTVANVAVTDAATGGLLGAIGLRVLDGKGEVGYWTAPWARGRGVATRAARLQSDWGFEALSLPRVELLADVRNTASQRVAEAAGFTKEGVLRAVRPAPRSTERVDMVLYARLPTD